MPLLLLEVLAWPMMQLRPQQQLLEKSLLTRRVNECVSKRCFC